MQRKKSRGLFIGRFQPFHKGHLKDVKYALKFVDELIIALGSCQEKNTKMNPLSAEERKEMIKKVLKSEKINRYSIFTIPDFYNDYKWVQFLEFRLPKFNIVFTGNPWTKRCFAKKGHKIKKIIHLKGISSTIIRDKIIKNKNWKKLVPKKTAEYLEQIKGIERIKEINKKI